MSPEIFGAVNIEFCEYSFKNSIFIIIRQIGYISNLSAVNFFIIVFVKGYIKSFQVVPACKPCIVVIIALFYLIYPIFRFFSVPFGNIFGSNVFTLFKCLYYCTCNLFPRKLYRNTTAVIIVHKIIDSVCICGISAYAKSLSFNCVKISNKIRKLINSRRGLIKFLHLEFSCVNLGKIIRKKFYSFFLCFAHNTGYFSECLDSIKQIICLFLHFLTYIVGSTDIIKISFHCFIVSCVKCFDCVLILIKTFVIIFPLIIIAVFK